MACKICCWISEHESNWQRRTLLVVSVPLFIAWNIGTLALAVVKYLLLMALWSVPRQLIRSLWVVCLSFCLRWNHAKPKGQNDWVSERVARANGEKRPEVVVKTWRVQAEWSDAQ